MPTSKPTPPSDDARILLPWSRSCFVCGQENPRGLKARSFRIGDRVEMPFVASRELAGWAAVIHGGLVATVLDEVMTWAALIASRRACFAAEFTVRLRRPLAPETSCVAVGRLAAARRRVFDTEAWLRDEAETVYASAAGRYLPIRPDQLGAMRHDFVTGEGSLAIGDILDLGTGG
jgi:acyl-coenzyme A thioesterase PaaI-like protein